MKVYLTNELSDELKKLAKEEVNKFIRGVDRIKDMSKTEIMRLDSVVKLSNDDKVDLLAYNIYSEDYVIFTFIRKNEMLLIDKVCLAEDGIKSLVYDEHMSSGNNKE